MKIIVSNYYSLYLINYAVCFVIKLIGKSHEMVSRVKSTACSKSNHWNGASNNLYICKIFADKCVAMHHRLHYTTQCSSYTTTALIHKSLSQQLMDSERRQLGIEQGKGQ